MGKTFFYIFSAVLILFYFSIPVKGDDLFLKIGIQPIEEKGMAPNFCLESLNGRKVELKNYKGKVIFLNFWATWCSPCKEEMPFMEALYQQFKEKNFVLLTISVDYEGMKPVKEFIEKNRYTFPVLLDQKCKTLSLFKIKGIPTTLIIDKKGRMIGRAIGPRNWKNPEVILLLNMLIEENK